MTKSIDYDLDTEDGVRRITIQPVHQLIPGTKVYATGVFKIGENKADLGDIVFDDTMRQWEYTCMGNLSHEQAAQIARFIQSNIKLQLKDKQINGDMG